MSPHSSFRSVLLTSLLLFQTTNAQLGALPITDVITNTFVDLYQMYNRALLDAASIDWQLPNVQEIARKPEFIDFAETSTIELMAGPAEEASKVVVDIVGINLARENTYYHYPTSLPLGLYHFRINVILNATSFDESKIQRLTARSATINVTTSSPIGCGPKMPAPFKSISSASSPDFSSLRIVTPSAGFNVARDPEDILTDRDTMKIRWDTINARNLNPDTISNITIRILDDTQLRPVGPLLTPPSPQSSEILVNFTDFQMKLNESYRVELKYRNQFPDGAIRPGDVVTVVSPAFNFVVPEARDSDCTNFTSNDRSSDPTPSDSKRLSGFMPVTFHQIAWVGCLATVIHLI